MNAVKAAAKRAVTMTPLPIVSAPLQRSSLQKQIFLSESNGLQPTRRSFLLAQPKSAIFLLSEQQKKLSRHQSAFIPSTVFLHMITSAGQVTDLLLSGDSPFLTRPCS